MQKLKNILPWYVKLTIYNSLISCHLNSGLLIWGNKSNLDRILKLQKRAVRIILNKKYNCHTEPLFKKLRIIKITDMLDLERVKFIYKYHKKLLPFRLLQIPCVLNTEVHSYFTRSSKSVHRTRCHNKSLQALLESGFLNSISPEILQLVNLSENEPISLRAITKKFKNFTLNNYSDSEICQDLTCFSCTH